MTDLRTATPTQLGDVRDFLGFRFPGAQLLDAAAGMFPQPYRRQQTWDKTGPGSWFEGGALAPSSWPRLTIAPGLLAMERHDLSADERSHERMQQNRDKTFRRRQAELKRALYGPMAFAMTPGEIASIDAPSAVSSTRGEIVKWSTKSRGRLVRKILSLDLEELTTGAELPVMVTLTLPDRWLEVMPSAEVATAKMGAFRRRYERAWGKAAWIWKREFQGRGAPHWHLWMVPPTSDLRAFRAWLSDAWTDSLAIDDPEERRRSRVAGTNVSQAEGMKARDPKRLAVYFLKESLGGESKAYQNEVPVEWRGDSAGRFWGVVGLDTVTRVIDLDPELASEVWRILRHVRNAKSGTRRVLVQRVNYRTGVVRSRWVTRRTRARGHAGWVAVNDGAVTASQLARWLHQRRTTL